MSEDVLLIKYECISNYFEILIIHHFNGAEIKLSEQLHLHTMIIIIYIYIITLLKINK